MRFLLYTYGDGSTALVSEPFAGTNDAEVKELTEEEARDYYKTAESIDVISADISDKFEAEV